MFAPLTHCWICGHRSLERYHECRFDFHEYATQDPELHAYTGATTWLVRCTRCGFGQPEQIPVLPRFFDRMYDQRWSAEWIEREFEAGYKDFIFDGILRELERRQPAVPRRLLDVGAHAGRFMATAKQKGWSVEGIELNPATAACAARRTGAIVHQVNAHALSATTGQYDAVTLTDVLEHIPEPVRLLESTARLLKPGGWIAVKVPCGRSQWQKERVLSALKRGRRVSLADNLVHVNHFTPRSLEAALTRAGFAHVCVKTGAPELTTASGVRDRLSNAVRMSLFAAASVPGGVHTPLAFNLQAYAMKADAA